MFITWYSDLCKCSITDAFGVIEIHSVFMYDLFLKRPEVKVVKQ